MRILSFVSIILEMVATFFLYKALEFEPGARNGLEFVNANVGLVKVNPTFAHVGLILLFVGLFIQLIKEIKEK